MKRNTRTLLCILCAILAVVCVIFAGFMLIKGKNSASPASSASSGSTTSIYGSAADYDYQNFNYSDGLDAKGYRTGIRALDYVTLPADVAALPIAKADITPTEADIQSQIDSLLTQYTTSQTVTGRAAQKGDTVNIDYAGTVDGVAFTGGTCAGYDLTLGSGSFIDGFEDQIVGHNIGDTFDVNVTFPTGYNDSTDAEGNAITLSGKAAVFSVTLNSISQSVTPELTDAWVDTTFGTSDGLHTVEALRSYYAAALQDSDLENALMDALLDGAQFKELPKEVTSYYIRLYLNYYYSLASNYYQTDLETFAKANGYADVDAMMADSDSMFTHLAKQDLLYQAIAETQNIQPTQEQLDTAAASYSADLYGENFIYQTALQNAVMDWLKSTAVIS